MRSENVGAVTQRAALAQAERQASCCGVSLVRNQIVLATTPHFMPTSAPTPPLLSRMTLVAAMLLFAASSVSADGDEVDCSGMKTKALRQWLAARALKCDGCTEKADFVALCENNKDAPLAKPPDLNDKQMPNFMRTPGQKEDASMTTF